MKKLNGFEKFDCITSALFGVVFYTSVIIMNCIFIRDFFTSPHIKTFSNGIAITFLFISFIAFIGVGCFKVYQMLRDIKILENEKKGSENSIETK